MKWMFWKRSSNDRLVRKFVEYGIHLLPIPRENVSVSDVYPVDGEHVLESFKLMYALKNPIGGFSSLNKGEIMSGIKGEISGEIKSSEGLEFLESFLTAIGGGIITGLRLHYEKNGIHFIKYRFDDPTRDSIDPGELGQKLINNSMNLDHPMYKKGRRYFVVTSVLRTKSITVTSLGKDSMAVDLDLKSVIDSLTKLSISGSGYSEITYSGAKRIAFGIQVLELKSEISGDDFEPKFTFVSAKDMSGFRSRTLNIRPSIIGDSKHGSVFLSLT